MNRYVVHGMLADAVVMGRRVGFLAGCRAESVETFHALLDECTPDVVVKANGRESIQFANGGRVDFIGAPGSARGRTFDVLVAANHTPLRMDDAIDLLPSIAPSGELVRL